MGKKMIAVDSLALDPGNARRHSQKNLDAIMNSLRRFGQQKPIVVDGSGVVRAGNGTLAAARALGWEQIWVVRTGLVGAEAAAFAVADNRTAELAEWDQEVLATLLESGEIGEVGFDQGEIDAILNASELADNAGREESGEVPEAPEVADSQPGDLYILGRHRLLCGDSTNAADVARLMEDERAGLMNTDPPYGVSYANDDRPNPGVAKPRVAKPRVANDKLQDQQLQEFLEKAFRAAVEHALTDNAAWYMWHAHLTQGYFAAAAAAANVVLHRQIIWVKPVLLLGRGQYHWKHEPCFMGWVAGKQPPDYGLGKGERTQTTIWEIDGISHKERKELNHSTPKPVELFAIPMIKHLKAGENAFEPFAGSGPQFIAGEKTGRRCLGLEIAPAFCDVIVGRWEKFTGKKAERRRG